MGFTGKVDKTKKISISKIDVISGKKLLVVGGTSGIGRGIALEAVSRGATVKVVGRSFKDEGVSRNLSFEKADLSLMKEAKQIGETADSDVDVIVLTTGIVAAPKRVASSEGIEMDTAVSYLSRLVILKYLVPRLTKSNARVFIMGFPGGAMPGHRADDLNAEKDYAGAFGWVHTNTIIGNEALVYDWAAKEDGHSYFGLNPGLVQTGIRGPAFSSGFMKIMGVVMEGLIAPVFAQSTEGYGKATVDLIFASSLDGHNGISFNPKGKVTLPSPAFRDDPALTKTFVGNSVKLVETKAGV